MSDKTNVIYVLKQKHFFLHFLSLYTFYFSHGNGIKIFTGAFDSELGVNGMCLFCL